MRALTLKRPAKVKPKPKTKATFQKEIEDAANALAFGRAQHWQRAGQGL